MLLLLNTIKQSWKKIFYFFIFLFFYFSIFLYSSAAAEPTIEVMISPSILAQYVAIPGKIVYFSNYMFESNFLLTLNKQSFSSWSDNSLPVFDYFYCKVILNSGEARWCIVFFNNNDSVMYSVLSPEFSRALDEFFPETLQLFKDGVNSLDWKTAFFDKVCLSFKTST